MAPVARLVVFALVCVLAAPAAQPAFGQGASPAEARAARNYRQCMQLARSSPTEAFEFGLGWEDEGGGPPARHCQAIALMTLEQYPQAAERLEALAQDVFSIDPEIAIEALAQAGQAWYLAGDYSKAYTVQSAVLERQPGNASLLIDRGVTLAESGRLEEAIQDFSTALLSAPGHPDAHLFRASALRQLERLPDALADADASLRSNPNNAEAYLERGNIRRLLGDVPGARADWVEAATRGQGTMVEETAQENLQNLELNTEGGG
ncbi:MAG: tetratricopeptide repeat protein [Alphaproteobacteria bacterium]|nr:tetratricopeptide repeat protein [Alphaproteobacteria bacterium]